MNAGKLDRRITIETPVITYDEWNHPQKSWGQLALVWASKTDRTESEVTELSQTVAINRTVWTIRWRDDITTAQRIQYNNDLYEIKGIKELGRREGLQITTERRK